MPLIAIDDVSDPRLADYRHLPDPALLRRGEIFIAEGRHVVRVLLAASPLTARSLLLTPTAYQSLRDLVEPRLGTLPVYVVPAGAIQAVTGFDIHRGCLAAGERPRPRGVEALLGEGRDFPHGGPRTIVVLERVANADNVGGVFRNAAAFGADAVVLGPNCCDPLYRKAIRVSMGASLRVGFASAETWPGAVHRLREHGFTVAALTPRAGAIAIDAFAAGWTRGSRLALLAGAEGDGLSEAALSAADVALRIPLAPGTDSLNLATATGIALHLLGDTR